ncbi:UPF0430 protein CG31712-like isoform X1 [Artemia franciscana]|uniref:Stathmin n=2 Tax=Artemia franciscana TaxID=6661 RepID=A0AA88H3C6_ARTSF|nr:hypothetical protein QYM36_017885 [Artemia franciscana]
MSSTISSKGLNFTTSGNRFKIKFTDCCAPASNKAVPVLVHQPKMESKATEIRGEEKSKGGVKYEVVLAPSTGSPPRAKSPSTTPISAADIQKKLKEAEERRRSLQDSVQERIHARLEGRFAAVQESLQNKFEELNKQINEKQELSQANREQYLEGIKEKVRQHIEHVESVRNQLQEQVNEARVDLEKDLSRRGENREKQIEELRERMRAHEEHVQNVRKNNDQRIKDLERKIQERMDNAAQLRAKLTEEELIKLRGHSQHVEAVREKRRSNGSPTDAPPAME